MLVRVKFRNSESISLGPTLRLGRSEEFCATCGSRSPSTCAMSCLTFSTAVAVSATREGRGGQALEKHRSPTHC